MISEEEAIRLCKIIWQTVVEGKAKNKGEAISILRRDIRPQVLDMKFECPLCEYTINKATTSAHCYLCPYKLKYGIDCVDEPSYRNHPVVFAKRIMEL
jgi:hypothetical protein